MLIIIKIIIIYYLCTVTPATRPITETAQKRKENKKIQKTKKTTYRRCNKNYA